MIYSSFTINDLEKLSGIKAHTIRIWEKRYEILNPKRVGNNSRVYSNEDLKKILNISYLNANNHKISEIAKLSINELNELVNSFISVNNKEEDSFHLLLQTALDLDEVQFTEIYNRIVMKYGFEKAITNVLFPFLRKVGSFWLTNAIHAMHEHFITSLIRQKIIAAIDSQTFKKLGKDSKKYLIFLPENELHELKLLTSNYYIKSKGHQTLYLGFAIPHEDIDDSVILYNPDYILLAVTNIIDTDKTIKYIEKIAIINPLIKVFVIDYTLLNHKSKCTNIQNIESLENLIV